MSAPSTASVLTPRRRFPLVRDLVADRRLVRLATALLIVYVVWGSTYLAIGVVVAEIPPMLAMAARFAVAGSVLFVVAVRRGDRSGDRIRVRQVFSAFATGALLLVGGTGMVSLAQTSISSGLAALIGATVPVFIALFARGAFGERLSRRAWVGLGVGLAGIATLVNPGGGQMGAIMLAFVGSAAWAAGSLRSRVADAPRRPLVAAGLEMVGAALLFALLGLARAEHVGFAFGEVSGGAWFALLYLTIAGSLVAYTAYSWLMRNGSTTLVGTYAYVNPVVAVGLGWLLLGETVTGRTAFAGLLVLLGVVLLVTGRPGEPVPAQPTSGADVFAGSRRWHRAARRVGSLPRAARLYRDPGVRQLRSTGYDDVPPVDPALSEEPRTD